MKKLLIFVGLLSLLSFMSCDNEPVAAKNETSRNSGANEKLRSIEEAIDIANTSASLFFGSETSRGYSPRKAGEVKVIRGKWSRSTDSDTLLYIVNYEDSAGFAVIAANRSIEPLFAVTESGFYDGTETGCDGFDMYMDLALEFVRVDTLIPRVPGHGGDKPVTPGGGNTRDTTGLITVYPGGEGGGNTPQPNPGGTPYQTRETDQVTWIVNQQPKITNRWSQEDVEEHYWGDYWGIYCKNKTVGCGPLAAAMVMSYYERPTQFSGSYYEEYRNGQSQGMKVQEFSVDWSLIKRHNVRKDLYNMCGCYDGTTTHNMIARLGRHIGFIARANYKFGNPNTTGVTMDNLRNAMIHYGFNCEKTADYKGEKLENIGTGVAIIGGDDYSEGHACVLDGVKRYRTVHTVYYREKDSDPWKVMSRNSSLLHFNHFNWGWGYAYVGWFNDNVFQGNLCSDPDQSSNMSGNASNYNHNVKFFIIR